MAENFKKRPHLGKADPALEHGSQAWGNKVAGGGQKKYPHAQDPHTKKRPSGHRAFGTEHDPHSAPDTPHSPGRSAGLMSPVSKYGQIRMHASPIQLIKHRSMNPEKVLAKGSQEWSASKEGGSYGTHTKQPTERGVRYPKGGMESVRPNVPGQSAPAAVRTAKPQPHDMSGAITPRLHVRTTKKIKGLIGGKGKHNRQRSAY